MKAIEITQEHLYLNPELLKNDSLGDIKQFGKLPLVWNRINNFRVATPQQLSALGFKDFVTPTNLAIYKKLGNKIKDLVNDVFTYEVLDFTAQEIIDYDTQQIQNTINIQQSKKQEIVQAKITEQIEVEMNDINLPITNIIDNIDFYEYWQVDTIYGLNKVVRLIGTDQLYRCVQSHTSQADWSPELVPALFTPIVLPGTIGDWVQPTGAQDAYQIGDQVHFPAGDPAIYESLINANTWSPTAYPAGWVLI